MVICVGARLALVGAGNQPGSWLCADRIAESLLAQRWCLLLSIWSSIGEGNICRWRGEADGVGPYSHV